MAVYKEEEIVGMYRGKEVTCSKCMSDEDWASLTKDNILTQRQVENEDKFYFCHSCNERIVALSAASGPKRPGGN